MKAQKKPQQKPRKYQKPQIKSHGKISEVASAFKP
jgi:hypothetical protein